MISNDSQITFKSVAVTQPLNARIFFFSKYYVISIFFNVDEFDYELENLQKLQLYCLLKW